MAGEVYGYIIGLVITGIIFISAVAVVPNLSYVNLLYVDQQQLRNTALETMKAILLQAGSPTSWGSEEPFNQDSVSRFGLACTESSSSYVLDSDKVQRLVVDNPIGYVEYDKMRELLGLEGYGFSISILPPFNVTIIDPVNVTGTTLRYGVKVSYLDGRPIPTATTHAVIVYILKDKFGLTRTDPHWTDTLGICRENVTLSISDPESVVVILRVSVADVTTLIVTFGKSSSTYVADINMVGDNVILTKAKDPSNEDVKLLEIFAFGSRGSLTSIYNGTAQDHFNTGEGEHRLWTKTFPGLRTQDPAILVVNFDAVDKGRKEIIVTGPYQNLLGYTVFEYSGAPTSSSAAVKLQRSVIISGMTYIVELTLWKE